MESGPAANSVLVSPLAVDDVFRHRTVPEVQELLRQLQLQQANDVEELRSLIGVRYLSFLEGLPEITRMQQSAEDALEDARAFGTGLRRLANALGDAVSEVGEQQSREHQQLCLEEELPLQNSTPLDDFLFSCEVDASTPAVYFPPRKGHRAEPAPRFRVYPCLTERHAALQGQAEPLRYLQQQLLVLPSRVWEAARCQKFLEALRLIHIEGTRQAAAARAAVRELQQQHQQGLKPAQQNIERLISGCLALAQQVTRISPSLRVSLRALAIRQLASPELPLPVVADAAAAATLIYLLESRASVGEATKEAEKILSESAAKWLLGVFFSARVEALECILAKRKKDGGPGEVASPTPPGHVRSNFNCNADTMEPEIDAAESMLVAFAASLEAAVSLFSPHTADSVVLGATDIASRGAAVTCSEASTFAATRAAEVAFRDESVDDSPDVSWALRALPGVFAVFAAQPCCKNGNERVWGYPCGCEKNNELCPRARMASFIEQWSAPLREQLCVLPSENPRRSLRDIRFFWLRLIEKLKGRGTRWQLPTGPLFWVGGAPPSHSDISSTSSHDWVPCDKPLCNATLELLDALGKSCSNTCICVSERRVRELPLLSCRTLNDGMSGASTPLKAEDERSQNAFEEDLRRHLVDIAYLFGRVEDPQELRAALPLRAAIAASFLQSLSECTTPLVGRAIATVATAVDAQPSDGCTRDKDAYAALILDARRVEWLFVAYREAETLPKHDNSVVSTEVASVPELAREDSGEADCRRKFASFLAEWISWDSQRQDISEVHLIQPSNGDRAEGGNNAETAQVVATARAAAQSLLPNLCCSSFVGYAVGFWPFVRTKVEELQKSWQWHKTASATPAAEAQVSTIDISGGAMSFLLELSRHLIAVSRSLKVDSVSESPLMSFALKAVAAEAVATVAVAAIAETKGTDHKQQKERQHTSSASQSHLLQLLVDIELLAEALDESSPLQQAYEPCDGVGALPRAIHRAVQAGMRGQRCAKALKNTAEEGRQWLQPSSAELLQRRLEMGFTASNALIWALLPPSSPESGGLPSTSISARGAGTAFQLPLLEPRERLSLLPVAPLPAFEAFLRSSSYERCDDTTAHKSVASNANKEEEQQQAPKEALKQLHRLRLDDAVDSVSRGLQSWLKRGSSDTDNSGIFPSRAGGGASSGASKGVTAVAAAGSGLAEAWAKQVGHVSALIGQRVESVQRASQAAASSQRNGKQSSANAPASLIAD